MQRILTYFLIKNIIYIHYDLVVIYHLEVKDYRFSVYVYFVDISALEFAHHYSTILGRSTCVFADMAYGFLLTLHCLSRVARSCLLSSLRALKITIQANK